MSTDKPPQLPKPDCAGHIRAKVHFRGRADVDTVNTTPYFVMRPGVRGKRVELPYATLDIIQFYCQDCRALHIDNFMVQDWLWKSLQLSGIICVACFEKRLGRPLAKQDLKEAPVNSFVLRYMPPMDQAAWEADRKERQRKLFPVPDAEIEET